MSDTPRTDAESEPREILASRLIDAWCEDKGRKIPWAKVVQIVAIVTKQSDAERDRLLRMGEEDGSCEMCGRNAVALESDLTAANAEIEKLRFQIGEFKKDTERYRGLLSDPKLMHDLALLLLNNAYWDASILTKNLDEVLRTNAVDAAIAAGKQETSNGVLDAPNYIHTGKNGGSIPG